MIEYNVTEDIATLTIDAPSRSQNVMDRAMSQALMEALARAIADPAARGILIASGKSDFVAGADLAMLAQPPPAAAMFAWLMEWHRSLRALETCGKPVACAMPGSALGQGLELALAAHHRVAAENPAARFGLPEVTFGLLPGGGGTQRLARLLGFMQALPLLLEGKRLRAGAAHKAGIVDAIVPAGDERAAGRAWIRERLDAGVPVQQPWDVRGFKLPGGAVQSPSGVQTFMAGNAMLHEKTFGNYPAATNIMSCVYEGLQTDIDTGLKIEARYFVQTVHTPEARNMIRLLFFGVRDANRLANRPEGVPHEQFTKVGVLGAGMMGAGIAYATAAGGIQTVLLDTSVELAERGKGYSHDLLAKQVARGSMTQPAMDAVLARIQPTDDFEALRGCELAIETVFEDRAVKADATKRAYAVVGGDAIVASNTSTLPIGGLAEASGSPERFIGLHFFSPADRMPLVEIIVASDTSDATLAQSMDYVRAIGKTPIVVRDSRGFYTSRVFATYIVEGLAMLAQGVAPALIDNAGRMAGMPVGPLALTDEVSVELVYKINKQTRADVGGTFVQEDAERVAIEMVETFKRLGRKAHHGFYDYASDGAKRLWPDLAVHYPPRAEQPDVRAVIDRLIAIQSIEAARCLEEKIVARPIDADVGALLGWGYPAFRGGPIGWIDTVGAKPFVDLADRLAAEHGPRFAPPQTLRTMAETGGAYYGAAPPSR